MKPIAIQGKGVCFAFPDVCKTPTPGGPVPIPYPNIAQLAEADKTSKSVLVGDKPVILKTSQISKSMGDQAGTAGGVVSGKTGGKVTFTTASGSVQIEDAGVVRMLDQTQQNDGNAQGVVLGGVPTVLIGD